MSSFKGGPQNPDSRVHQNGCGKWVAEIRHTHRPTRLVLGPFSTALEAALAYDSAARKLYGPRAPDLVIIDNNNNNHVHFDPNKEAVAGRATAPVPIPDAQTVDGEEAPELYSKSAGSDESVNSYALTGGAEAYRFEVSDFEGLFEDVKVAAPVAKYPMFNESLCKEVVKEEFMKFGQNVGDTCDAPNSKKCM